jgi:hypothetical protein
VKDPRDVSRHISGEQPAKTKKSRVEWDKFQDKKPASNLAQVRDKPALLFLWTVLLSKMSVSEKISFSSWSFVSSWFGNEYLSDDFMVSLCVLWVASEWINSDLNNEVSLGGGKGVGWERGVECDWMAWANDALRLPQVWIINYRKKWPECEKKRAETYTAANCWEKEPLNMRLVLFIY